uniref:Uncharacterized protein n=1 Tax=Romanomermis culicivorax TaxID=13658 RepID=A0A915HNF8_ROMCU
SAACGFCSIDFKNSPKTASQVSRVLGVSSDKTWKNPSKMSGKNGTRLICGPVQEISAVTDILVNVANQLKKFSKKVLTKNKDLKAFFEKEIAIATAASPIKPPFLEFEFWERAKSPKKLKTVSICVT